jgi:hemerythrin-like domain-containing protein
LNELSLAIRDGLPDDLLALRAKHPREVWPGHANLGEWTQFWLSRHRIFRDLDVMLSDACGKLQGGEVGIGDFTPWFLPRLEYLLGHLDLHHKIEEFHIFPAFARAEPALERGFALLESDHEEIHVLTDAMQAAAALLGQAGAMDADRTHRAGDAVANSLAPLLRGLDAHLNDEEDLIVPIVLERTEPAIGLF